MAIKDKNTLVKLAKVAFTAKANAPVAYSYNGENFSLADVNETLRESFKELGGSYQLWRENKNTIFQIMEETFDDILPKKVMQQYGQFADVRTIAQGDKVVYKQKITEASRRRAKQFVTRVGLAGRYEVFKLDGSEYEVKTSAYGAAIQIGLEEFLDGHWDMSDYLEVITEAFDEVIYAEIAKALIAAVSGMQKANKFGFNGFNETEMDRLISIADSYGQSTIYCTFEFAAAMLPNDSAWYSDRMKEQRWENGYFANYKGHNVVVLEQSFTDETNTTKTLDPSYAWIIPTGAEKPVKVVYEGQTLMKEVEGDDWSKTMHTYKKVGVGALVKNNVCVYRNTALSQTPTITSGSTI